MKRKCLKNRKKRLVLCYNKNMKRVVRILDFRNAEKRDTEYWKKASPEEKLDTLQSLRDIYFQLKNENRKGFQRVYRIIKHK